MDDSSNRPRINEHSKTSVGGTLRKFFPPVEQLGQSERSVNDKNINHRPQI
jgi:hypothetical protein